MHVWSHGEIEPLFMDHEGYFGSVGSFLDSLGVDAKGDEEAPGGRARGWSESSSPQAANKHPASSPKRSAKGKPPAASPKRDAEGGGSGAGGGGRGCVRSR